MVEFAAMGPTANPWSARLPLVLRLSVIFSLVAAGGWAFTEAVVTIEGSDLADTLSTPLVRWVQIAGTLLCVGAVAALSWSPSVRYGALGATGALVLSGVLAGWAWVDTAPFAPDSLLVARDIATAECTACTSRLEANLGAVAAFVASFLAAAGAGFIAYMARE